MEFVVTIDGVPFTRERLEAALEQLTTPKFNGGDIVRFLSEELDNVTGDCVVASDRLHYLVTDSPTAKYPDVPLTIISLDSGEAIAAHPHELVHVS
jgi:hypothetical protein